MADEGEVKLSAFEVGTLHTYADLLAEGISVVLAATDELNVALVKLVVVVLKIAEGHKPFASVLVNLYVESKFRDTCYSAHKLPSETVSHELHLLVLDAGTFGRFGKLLHGRTVLATLLIGLCVGTARTRRGVAVEEAMNHHVGVAAYGGGEVGVVVEHEAIVTNVLGAVACFLHGTQSYVFNHLFLGCAMDVSQKAIEAAGYLLLAAFGSHPMPKTCHEGAEFL